MVAVILIVASVVIISMLQGQTESYGNFSDSQTQGSSCGLAAQRLATTIDCPTASVSNTNPVYSRNSGCWPSTSAAADAACN